MKPGWSSAYDGRYTGGRGAKGAPAPWSMVPEKEARASMLALALKSKVLRERTKAGCEAEAGQGDEKKWRK